MRIIKWEALSDRVKIIMMKKKGKLHLIMIVLKREISLIRTLTTIMI